MKKVTKVAKKVSGKRTLIDNGKAKTYVHRNKKGQFKDGVAVGRSLAADKRRTANTKVKPGYGDRGDVKR